MKKLIDLVIVIFTPIFFTIAIFLGFKYIPNLWIVWFGKPERYINIPGTSRWQVNIEASTAKTKEHDYFYAIAIIKNDSVLSLKMQNNIILTGNDFIPHKYHLIDDDNEVFLWGKNGIFYDLKLVKRLK